jgi:hypothetical protein
MSVQVSAYIGCDRHDLQAGSQGFKSPRRVSPKPYMRKGGRVSMIVCDEQPRDPSHRTVDRPGEVGGRIAWFSVGQRCDTT